jgi:heme-degrading monooxygenase HmoA
MIARVWHGWTTPLNAEVYETHFRTAVLPHLQRVEGYIGAQLLRRADGEEVEFMAVTYFESIEAIRAFAGPDYDIAVVAPEARQVLARFDQRATHHQVVLGRDEVLKSAEQAAAAVGGSPDA